jgi:uncharacterized protein (DUF2141 family)
MKRISAGALMALFLLFFTVIIGGVARAEDALPERKEVQTGRIKVRILDLRNDKGDLLIALFNAKKGFPGKPETAVRKSVIPAAGEEHFFVFENVPFGTYALTVRHDENRNGKLDTNFLGMPKEGVGTSNNPHSRFGPPSFDDARFVLDRDETELVIRLRYL